MAKKTTTTKEKKVREKKPKVQNPASDFNPFIKTVVKDVINNNKTLIKEICESAPGLEPISLENWNKLNAIIIEISKFAELEIQKNGSLGMFCTHIHHTPIKRQKYTITQQVREMQRKGFILKRLEMTPQNEGDEVYYNYLIYSHIAIWLEENGKTEDKKK